MGGGGETAGGEAAEVFLKGAFGAGDVALLGATDGHTVKSALGEGWGGYRGQDVLEIRQGSGTIVWGAELGAHEE